ncbi:phospholipase D family protein [Sulfitobacter sp. D35]|uniref:phospholipase D family protein n=1 Tax=Sulfitobacter sp. D35 TaxID=3083252 RepID=UPI00296F7F6A|nr:phospholipase D family protein [Sulfitobacter sp. D35]MDW4499737.1 phospholipase D family protein [Sulfitobacter sp. D35]
MIQMALHRVVAIGLMLALSACAPKVVEVAKPRSAAFSDTGDTFLASRARALGDPGNGTSGVRLVASGPEALALRLLLSERAERSIDAQYYILHNDTTGHLFAGELLRAADRGVRVRLLLDDMYTAEYDPMTAALTRHPNIEIRLFNPFRRDIGRVLGGLLEFGRINRRMHNKSMTFDNQVTLVGGRNIGDEYFAAREDSNYDDLDLLAAGPVVRDVSAVFDDYWNSPYAIPADVLIGPMPALSTEDARARMQALYEAAKLTEYGSALDHEIRAQLQSARLQLDWVPAQVESDPPDKAGRSEASVLADDLLPVLQAADSELVVASAYFVPGPRGTALLTGLARRGIRVTILTNSMDSNDVEPVHAHYSKYRKALLEAGVELWELRPNKERPDRTLLQLGQSLSGLHSKAFAVDERHFFIGSFNWDPRSVALNTEMGILIDAPRVTRAAIREWRAGLPDAAYRLVLTETGEIAWLEKREDGSWTGYGREPTSSGWRRFRMGLYRTLPIRRQL